MGGGRGGAELGAAVPKSNNVPLSAAVATQGKTFRVRRNPGVLPSESAACVQPHKYLHTAVSAGRREQNSHF